MKKIGKLLGIILLLLCSLNVNAANYELKELIPKKIETTIVTKHFSYRSFYYDGEGYINFKSIKNISDEELPISITIALFGKDKKNVGTIFYCSSENKLVAKEEKSFSIPVSKAYLEKGKNVKDIQYISVLDENINCRTEGSDYYIGQTVEEIGQAKNTSIGRNAKIFFIVIGVVGGLILLLFILDYMFTSAYENMDGDDVRIGYRKYNRQLKDERERQLRLHPPKPKEVKKTKTD